MSRTRRATSLRKARRRVDTSYVFKPAKPRDPTAGRASRRWGAGCLLLVAMSMLGATECRLPQLAPCTQNATSNNLQSQINTSSAGAVICLGAGTFPGSIVFQGKTGVTLRGQGTQATTIGGGGVDGLLVLNSQNLTFQNFTLSNGHPTDAYISNSRDITFQGMNADRGGIGLHFDSASSGRITNSLIYSIETDGVLIRRGSAVQIDHSVIFNNGGAGVSAVGDAGMVTLDNSVISHNAGPGVFAGQVPCAPLPGGRLDVPSCYNANPSAFVSGIRLTLNASTVQESGSTGVVLFPGTAGTFSGNHILNNRLTGVFAWGATLGSQGDEFGGNEEHAVELRAYPSPLQPALLRAVGRLTADDIHNTVVLAATGTLGGGVLAQGATLDAMNTGVHGNRGIGMSFVNGSTGSVVNGQIYNNGGSALCLFNTGAVQIMGDNLSGNASNIPGVCLETT